MGVVEFLGVLRGELLGHCAGQVPSAFLRFGCDRSCCFWRRSAAPAGQRDRGYRLVHDDDVVVVGWLCGRGFGAGFGGGGLLFPDLLPPAGGGPRFGAGRGAEADCRLF
jgi:hypothetical protein